MEKAIKIKLPLDEKTLLSLKAGDRVLLSGEIYTARDKAHDLLTKDLKNGKPPFNLENQTIYYVGPTPARENMIVGSAGPTTSTRMDSFTAYLYDNGLKITIGKGYRSPDVKESIVRNKGLYLIAIGGSAAIISQTVKKVELIAYEELGTEAIRKMVVEDMPLIVGVDAHGNDIYDINKDTYNQLK